jgi:hypothetical protein
VTAVRRGIQLVGKQTSISKQLPGSTKSNTRSLEVKQLLGLLRRTPRAFNDYQRLPRASRAVKNFQGYQKGLQKLLRAIKAIKTAKKDYQGLPGTTRATNEYQD